MTCNPDDRHNPRIARSEQRARLDAATGGGWCSLGGDSSRSASVEGSGPYERFDFVRDIDAIHAKSPAKQQMFFLELAEVARRTATPLSVPGARQAFEALSQIKGAMISSQATEALCEYAAALHRIALPPMQATPYLLLVPALDSLQGIHQWHETPRSIAALQGILSRIRSGLGSCEGELSQGGYGAMIYGLKGIDVGALPAEVQQDLAGLLKVLGKSLEKAKWKLFSSNVAGVVHGLSSAFQEEGGPVAQAAQSLLRGVRGKVPDRLVCFDDLAGICGALFMLKSREGALDFLVDKLWDRVFKFDPKMMGPSHPKNVSMVEGRLIQQAFAVYGYQMPPGVYSKISPLDRKPQTDVMSTRSEERIAEWVSNMAGSPVVRTSFVSGFELDIRIGKRKLNVEVDGPFHEQPTARVRDGVRDRYLMEQGWRILRLSSNAQENFVYEQVKAFLDTP